MLSKGIALTALTLALAGLPAAAFAQARSDEQTTPNTGGVSKPGVPGKPGNKSGPAVTPQNGQTEQSGSSTKEPGQRRTREEDESGVKGLPGNKSGPAVTPNSGSSSGASGTTAPSR
jgi:hypothetical protein